MRGPSKTWVHTMFVRTRNVTVAWHAKCSRHHASAFLNLFCPSFTRRSAPMILFAFETYRAMAATIQKTACLASGRFRPVRFENAEICVHVETPTKNENCAILASISPPDEQLLFTLLLAHTLKKEGAHRVAAILPYLSYARHDKNKPGESLATAWVGELMRSSGIDEVITVDVHSERAKNLFPIPVLSLSPAEIFALALRRHGKTGATIVAPDEGAIARGHAVQMALGREAGMIPYFEKQRTAVGISHAGLIGTSVLRL